MRGAEGFAGFVGALLAVIVVVVRFLVGDDGVAVVEGGDGAEFFGIVVRSFPVPSLPEGRAAFAGGVIVGRGGAVFLFFAVVAVEEEGHDGSEKEEESIDLGCR